MGSAMTNSRKCFCLLAVHLCTPLIQMVPRQFQFACHFRHAFAGDLSSPDRFQFEFPAVTLAISLLHWTPPGSLNYTPFQCPLKRGRSRASPIIGVVIILFCCGIVIIIISMMVNLYI